MRRSKNILSIQSSVAYGHVGNSAAVFPLQRIGVSVWPVITVHFSNHLGYDGYRGPVLAADDVGAVVLGIEERGVFPHCDAVLSGYLGTVSLGRVVARAVERVRAANPAALYCCDPVMGDLGPGFFVKPDIPDFIKTQLVPKADLVTPNQFEVEALTGLAVATLDDAMGAARALRRMGPKAVLITSLRRFDRPADTIEVLLDTEAGSWIVATPELPLFVHGTGDVVAALFLGHMLLIGDPVVAVEKTVAAVYAIVEKTAKMEAVEIQLVAAQDAIADPPRIFTATKVR